MNISAYINNVIAETLKASLHRKALEEKEKQDATKIKPEQSQDQEQAPQHVQSSKAALDDETMKGKVELEHVIEKLNSIRSGKSLKTEPVAQSFEQYFNDLNDSEKLALFIFLKGIAQIVTGEVQGSSAVEPEDPPANISMKRGPEVQKKHIKPNIIKKPIPAGGAAQNVEDTTAPTPITPKK